MKIVLGNIGVIRWAEFGLSPFTIICGDNNSGKSYASYAFYGFLYFFNTIYRLKLPDDFIGDFINSGRAVYDVYTSLVEVNLIVGFTSLLPLQRLCLRTLRSKLSLKRRM